MATRPKLQNTQPEVQSEATTPSTECCGPSPEQAVWPWESQKLNQTKEPTTVRTVIVQRQSICQSPGFQPNERGQQLLKTTGAVMGLQGEQPDCTAMLHCGANRSATMSTKIPSNIGKE